MMNRDTLTLLGCSGSLVLTLLAVNPAKANTEPLRELVFTAPVANSSQAEKTPVAQDTVDCGCTQDNSKYSLLDAASDTVGDLAIDKYGCDCAGCRNTVMRMAQTGQITVPK
jgi:hypothetical protein